MANYKIIQDKKAFEEFIEWLPELWDGEQYYFSLFARKKYDSTGVVKSDKSQIARGTAKKEWLYDKIKKLEVEVGSYRTNGEPIPQESLALYILPNPRSMKKASIKTAKMILDNIDKDKYQNPKSIALNAVQVSKSRAVFVDFDFDVEPNPLFKLRLFELAEEATGNKESFDVIQTRGGYHVLVRPKLCNNKKWHQELSKNSYVDQKGDLLLPVVGCCQGGFVPKFC